jgi:hypothetical protein
MRDRIDAAAAAVILQDYLDHQAREGQAPQAPASYGPADAASQGGLTRGEAEAPRPE